MSTKIESRNDYALFVKMEVAKLPISNKFKKLVRQLSMDGFDDGFAMHRDGGLEHDKFKEFKCRT